VILDGTLLPIDRHGINVQTITDPAGRASPALAGAVHDIKAARTHDVVNALEEALVECWADKGDRGAGGTIRVVEPTADAFRRRTALPPDEPGIARRHRRTTGMASGTVKWFNAEKGFGSLSQEGGGPDVFAHYSNVSGNA
jgi:hypothetical protein